MYSLKDALVLCTDILEPSHARHDMLTRAEIIEILEGELNQLEGKRTDDEAQLFEGHANAQLHQRLMEDTTRLYHAVKLLIEGHSADDNAQLRQALKHLFKDTTQLYRAVKLLVRGDGDDDALLYQALKIPVAALKSLEDGEVQPLIAAKKVKVRGKRPLTLTKQRYVAVGAVRALVHAGYGVEEAIEIVAEAHGRSPEAIDHWRKTMGNHTDPEAQGFMAQLPSSYALFAFTKHDLLSAIKQAGRDFIDAQEKKGK